MELIRSSVIIFLMAQLASVHAQNNIYSIGTEFHLMFLDNIVNRPIPKDVEIHVFNPFGREAQVQILLPNLMRSSCVDQSFSVPSRQIAYREICRYIRQSHTDSALTKKLVRVVSTEPVYVFAYNSDRYSADGTLIWPTNTLGHYHTVSTYFQPHIASQFGIAIPFDNTSVTIRLPASSPFPISIDLDGIRYTRGQQFTFRARAGSTFLAYNYYDLSGVTISSSRPVAIFGGNKRTFTSRSPSRDHLVEQYQSAGKWGTLFMYVPAPRSMQGDIVKFICRKGTCTVTIYGGYNSSATVQTLMVEQGVPQEVVLGYNAQIESSGQLFVSVIVRSQDGVGNSDPADPAFYILPHTGQYINTYSSPVYRYTVTDQPFDVTYIFVAIVTGQEGGVRLDGNPVPSNIWQAVPGGPHQFVMGALQVNSSVQHILTHTSGQAFMAMHYGASDRESFAVVLGATVGNFVDGCFETYGSPGDGVDNDCDGESDEEVCGNSADDDNDGIIDEDCQAAPPDAIGDSFAIVYMSNNNLGNANARSVLELYFTALRPGTVVNITAPAHNEAYAPSQYNLPLTVGSVTSFNVDPRMKLGDNADFSSGLEKTSRFGTKGILVQANYPILLYGVNKRGFSTDSFSCIPISSTGYRYRPVTQFPINIADDATLVGIVAHEDNTVILVELTVGVVINLGGQRHEGGTGTGTFTFTLQAFETVELQSSQDLSGIYLGSENMKKFSVFSGNIRNKAPIANRQNRDHLAEQIPSIDTWGTEFAVTSSVRPDPGDFYKVVASEPATTVRYRLNAGSAVVEITLENPGDTYRFDGAGNFHFEIKASKPVLLAQFLKSAIVRPPRTDPAMIIISPAQQWSTNYNYITPLDSSNLPYDNTLWAITRPEFISTMSLIMTANGADTVDNTASDASLWNAVQPIEGTTVNYYARIFSVGNGQIQLINSNPLAQYLGVMVGGSDRESYGNQISQRLSTAVIGCRPTPQVTDDGIDNDCDGRIDEETCNQRDDDRDLYVDEDCSSPPVGYRYYVLFQDNVVERMRFYPLEVYISNGNSAAITCRFYTPKLHAPAPHYDRVVQIAPDQVQAFAISPALRIYGTGRSWKSIVVDCDAPATVMGVNKETYSNDAFLSFSTQTLGMEYYTMSYGPAHLYTQFAIVAVTDGLTDVEIIPSATITYRGQTFLAGSSLAVQLDHCEVFQGQSEGDLSGTYISANKRIAAFSGNMRTNVVLSGSRDHLASMLPPTPSYGREFNVAPSATRTLTISDVYRVMARMDNTQIRIYGEGHDPNTPVTLNAGEWYQFTVSVGAGAFHVSASQPILLVQIQASQQSASAPEKGDPCMAVVYPEPDYVNRINLVTPLYTKGAGEDLTAQYSNWVSLIVPTNRVTGLRYNGAPLINPTVSTVAGTSNFQVVVFQIFGGFNFVRLYHEDPSVRFSGRLEGLADRETYCVSIGRFPTI